MQTILRELIDEDIFLQISEFGCILALWNRFISCDICLYQRSYVTYLLSHYKKKWRMSSMTSVIDRVKLSYLLRSKRKLWLTGTCSCTSNFSSSVSTPLTWPLSSALSLSPWFVGSKMSNPPAVFSPPGTLRRHHKSFQQQSQVVVPVL